MPKSSHATAKQDVRIVDSGVLRKIYPDLSTDMKHAEPASVPGGSFSHNPREAYLELARSVPRHVKKEPVTPVTAQAEALPFFFRRVSLKEELPQAARIHDDVVAYTRQFMISSGMGKLNVAPASALMESIVASLQRNPDALLCLSRMRSRDVYTYTHCVNTSILTALFACSMGASHDNVLAAGLAGLFHDLGKAFLPSSILTARRKLSEAEIEIMRRHPMIGCGKLASLPDIPSEVLMAALEHHERYDGSGYPKGLAGDAISEIGHMVGIIDTYDALSSRRPYKEALYPHKSLGIMYQMRKKQFHPTLVEQFVRLVGIYPVGSVVELKDGYRGVVAASNMENPMKPVVILALDPTGKPMRRHICDLSAEQSVSIAFCLPSEISGIDPSQVLGFAL